MTEQKKSGIGEELVANARAPLARRSFIKYAGFSMAGTALLVAGCKKDNPGPADGGVDLGSGDVGILNYAYALEQLEAAFYTKVVMLTNFTSIFSSGEQTLLKDIQAHEVIHREFFKAALGTSAIPALSVDFSKIDFTTRAGILGVAKTFEDLGVSAYNGAGQLISNSTTGKVYLTLAGKIVSVEARHASAIRDLLNPKSADFAGDDVLDGNGLDKGNPPATVLATAGAYITTKINYSNLPS